MRCRLLGYREKLCACCPFGSWLEDSARNAYRSSLPNGNAKKHLDYSFFIGFFGKVHLALDHPVGKPAVDLLSRGESRWIDRKNNHDAFADFKRLFFGKNGIYDPFAAYQGFQHPEYPGRNVRFVYIYNHMAFFNVTVQLFYPFSEKAFLGLLYIHGKIRVLASRMRLVFIKSFSRDLRVMTGKSGLDPSGHTL